MEELSKLLAEHGRLQPSELALAQYSKPRFGVLIGRLRTNLAVGDCILSESYICTNDHTAIRDRHKSLRHFMINATMAFKSN